jgi:PAS domain-containing protein
VVITVVDVSALKQTESQLRRMSKVFMDGADPIIIEDLNSHILDVNTEAIRIYGWKREELLGQSMESARPSVRTRSFPAPARPLPRAGARAECRNRAAGQDR